MKGKAVIPLALGLGMGLLAIKFGMDTVKKARGSTEQSRKVLRAKQDVDATIAITAEMLELASTLDKPSPTDPDFAEAKELVGRVTIKAIPKGAPVLKSMLAEPGTQPGVPGRIAPGYRAISVEIDEVTGVAFNVRPGDWVDVIVVMNIEGRSSKDKETIAEVVLQHIEVASVGLGSAGTAKGGAKTKTARSATLLIPEAEVTKLHLAATRGKITLALRGDEDQTVSGDKFAARSSEMTYAMKGGTGGEPNPASGQNGSSNPGSGGGLLSSLFGMMKNSSAPATAPSTGAATPPVVPTVPVMEGPPQPPPWSMIVSRGSTMPGTPSQAMRITYENATSNNVISVQAGMQPGGGAALRAKTPGAGSTSPGASKSAPATGTPVSPPPTTPDPPAPDPQASEEDTENPEEEAEATHEAESHDEGSQARPRSREN